MTLVQLRYLIAVIDSGLNISRAAQRASTTQPGISKQIKLLEEELGFNIFLRRGKSLDCLSDQGFQVVERARIMLAEAATIRTLAADRRSEAKGRIKIVSTPTQACFALGVGLSDLKVKHPGIVAQIRTVTDREAVDILDRGEADVAVVNGEGRPQGDYLALPLHRWALIAVAPADHVLVKDPKNLALADIAAYSLITDEAVWDADSALAQAFAAAGQAPRVVCTVNDAASVKAYVRDGLGIGLLAEMDTHRDMEGLSILNVEGLPDAYTTWALVRSDRATPNSVCEFLCALAPDIDRRDILLSLGHGAGAENGLQPNWRAPEGAAHSAALSKNVLAAPRFPSSIAPKSVDAPRIEQSA